MKMTSKEFWKRYYEMNVDFSMDHRERETAMRKFMDEWFQSMDVGDKAHVCLYTDIEPCTVIRKTKTTITIRYDAAELDPEWKPEWVPGGFCGHCINQEKQKWIITDDPNGREETFRWHKNDHAYMNCAGGCKLIPGWMKKYDFNF